MFKNTGSQKLTVIAIADAGHASLDAGEPVTGDAANITLKVEQDDDGTRSASNDTNPTETEDGQYVFDLTQAETNGDKLTFYPESSTAGVQVIALPSPVIYTRPPNFGALGIESDGDLTKVNTLDGHTAQTGDTFALANGATGFVAIDTVVDAIKVKTDFLPSATAGSAGGVFIAGTNAATIVTTSFTTTFTGNLTGNVGGNVNGTVAGVTPAAAGAQMDLVDAPNSTAVTAIQNGLATLANQTTLLGRLTASRAVYLDNLNVGGAVASNADILALNQSASRRIILTTVGQYERPESGSTVYTIEARTYDGDGAATNADSSPTLTGTGATTGSLAANIGTISNPATGVYRWNYTVTSGATIEPIRFDVSATISSSVFTLSVYSQVVDFVAVTWTTTDQTNLTAIYNKLPSADYLLGSSNADGSGYAEPGDEMDLVDTPNATAVEAIQNGLALADTMEGFFQIVCRSDGNILIDRTDILALINANEGSGGGDFDPQAESLEALRDRGDVSWITATGFATPSNVTTAQTAIVAEIDANEAKIDMILTYVGGLALLFDFDDSGEIDVDDKTIWLSYLHDTAGLQSASNAALVALHLDHLLAVDYDPASKPGTSTALLNELIGDDSGVSQFTANSLELGPSGSGLTAQQVRDAMKLAPSAGSPAAGSVDTHLDTIESQTAVLSGSGARTISITVDDGTTALEGATVRVTEGANTYTVATDVDGLATFNLDDATYNVAITKYGYTYAGSSLVVSADAATTLSMTAISTPMPDDPSLSTLSVLCLDSSGAVLQGVKIKVQMIQIPDSDVGYAYDKTEQEATSGEDGIATLTVVRGAEYDLTRGKSPVSTHVTIPDSATCTLTSIIGKP